MTGEELAEAIALLRSARTDVAHIEAKRATRDLPRSVRDTLSSFSNTAGGGVIILGLDESDAFAAVGVPDPGRLVANISDLCATNMEPPLRPLVEIHTFEDTQLVVVEVPELAAAQKPCFYKGAGVNGGSYVRVGDGDYRLNAYEVQMMMASRGQPREDEQPVAGATFEDLDGPAVERLLARVRQTRAAAFPADLDDEEALRRLKVLVPDGTGRFVPSLAGLLALGRYPQEFVPQLNVTFVHYPTTTGADARSGERFLDNKTIDGPIPVMVTDVLEVIRRNMARRSTVVGVGRAEVWEYPETALREAVVNALIHRDLSPASHGTQVQIEMYPDRLQVRNSGGLFGPVTVDQLGEEGVSSSRNAVLLKILEDVALPGDDRTICENRGSGIKAMISALRDADMGLPKFSDRIASFQVTFPNHTLMSEDMLRWLEQLAQEGLSDSQCVGLALMREGRTLTNAAYRTRNGLDSRDATAELQDLVARELVDAAGVGRWTSYTLSETAEAVGRPDTPRTARATPRDRRPEILTALGTDTLSRAELAEITGLKPQTVRRWLLTLRQEGAVEIIGGAPQSNKARYRAINPVVITEPEQLELRPSDEGGTT